jgi:hypothetical protein
MRDRVGDPVASTPTGPEPAQEAASRPVSDATHPDPRDDHGRHSPSRPAASVRVSRRRLMQLAAELPDRDRQMLDTVGVLRLARSDQLRSLFFSELATETTRKRICARALQRLTLSGLLRPLERRIGGQRAGSSGRVHALGPAGRRLLAHLNGNGVSDRGVHEPGLLFVTHTLAIGDLYVALVEAERAGQIELLAFETEPTRTYTSPIGKTMSVRPDVHVSIGVGEFEQLSFCELDLATEGRGALERKLQAYVSLYRSGREQAEHGLFPRVVWITEDLERAEYISRLIETLPPSAQKLFAVTVSEHAVALLAGTATPPGQGGLT